MNISCLQLKDLQMPSTTINRTSQQAFTLIELLVVISIISLLMAILLPVLSKARSAALAIKDASNVRSVNFALARYTLDSKDYILGYTVPKILPTEDTTNLHSVIVSSGYIEGSGETPATNPFPSVSSNPGKDTKPPLRCLDSTLTSRISNTTLYKPHTSGNQYLYGSSYASRIYTSYVYNHNFSLPSTKMVRMDDATRSPSDVIYFMCGDKLFRINTVVQWRERPNMFVHNGATNTAFLDGHVKALKMEAVTSDADFAL